MRATLALTLLLVACGPAPVPPRDASVTDVAPAPDVAPDAPAEAAADVALEASAPDATRDVAATDARPNCADVDGDGYGVGAGCLGTDCDDAKAEIHPGAMERCNGVDENCDGDADVNDAPSLDAYCVTTAGVRYADWQHEPKCIPPGRNLQPYAAANGRTSCQVVREPMIGETGQIRSCFWREVCGWLCTSTPPADPVCGP
jgi:hypothetical protein